MGAAVEPTHEAGGDAPQGPPGGARRRRRRAAVALLVLVIAASPALVSYVQWMTRPSSLPWTIRSVEWLRANHAAWLVNAVERRYYQYTAPSTGGPPLSSLPSVGLGRTSHVQASPARSDLPRRIRPLISPALRWEGVWRSTMPGLGTPDVMVTVFRPDPSYPRTVAYVAWASAKRTRLALYPGRYEPPGSGFRGPLDVPFDQRWRALAVFNSGFTFSDGQGGFSVNGHTFTPLVTGKATLVGYRNGRIDVKPWRGARSPGGDVVFARQNASMLVSRGRPAPDLTNAGADWGYTLGNSVLVWRTAVGVDSHGNLLYAAAPDQTTESLARLMVHAGAVRAMELDINAEWPTFNYYRASGARGATMLVPNSQQSADRYLVPDDRDFFVIYRRTPGLSPLVPLR
jgi:hypothetical protein